MANASVGELSLYYEISGPDDGDPLVLVSGLGAQMTSWYPGFVEQLEQAGFRVIRFDNRDIGLSTDLGAGAEYTVADMANDTVGLMDQLGIDSAHVAGMSMGGYIVQEMAINHPQRVRSLMILCSGPNNDYRTKDEEIIRIRTAPAPTNRDEAIAHAIRKRGLAGVEDMTEDEVAAGVQAAYDRSYRPDSEVRQTEAILRSEDRLPRLGTVSVPTLIVHGRADRLIDYPAAIAMAEAIPDAELLLFTQMQHQIRPMLWTDISRGMRRTADRAG